MSVSMIAAVAANSVIGKEGGMPWRLAEDLAFFKRVTMGHPMIMGRKTFLAVGRPLRGRKNIVVTRDPRFQAAGIRTAHSVAEALEEAGETEAFVIGGAEMYALFLPIAQRMYITHVDAEVPGDTFFPAVDWSQWRAVRSAQGTIDDDNPLPHRFVVYERRTQ